MERAIKSAEDYRLHVIKLVEDIGSDKAVDLLFKDHFETSGTDDVPAEIMKALVGKMVKVITIDHERKQL